MPAIDPRLVIAFIWIAGCFLATMSLLFRRPPTLPRLGYALVAAFLVRLIPALIFPRGARWEIEVFRQTGQAMLEGQNVYPTVAAYTYLPLQLYWLAAAYWLAEHVGLAFVFWLKVPNILAEVAMTGLIYSAIRRTGAKEDALFGGWVYTVNPITTLVAAYQGQFDAIPLFLMVTAWYLFEVHSDRVWGRTLSASVLGLGILSKSWPAILLPIVLLRLPRWRSRLAYTAAAAAVPALGVLLYELLFPGSLFLILKRAASPGAPPGWWGLSAILNVLIELTGYSHELFAFHAKIGFPIALLCGTCAILLTRHRSVLYSLMLTTLLLFAIFPNFGVQYLSWVIPMAVILGMSNEIGWYVAGATTCMAVGYWGLHFTDGLYLLMPGKWAGVIIKLSSLPAWGVIVLWSVQELLNRRFLPNVFRRSFREA